MTKDFRRYYVSKMMFLGAAMFLTSVGIASANPSDMSDFSEASPVVAKKQQAKHSIKGVVEDALGPIAGANVVEKGTTNGTITDMDGNFTLEVASNAILVVSYIGYQNQEISVNGQKDFKISLKEDSQALDEVVVVGYGTQKKVNLTGSVSSVNFEEQALSRPITNVSNALAGISAGVQVMQSSGQPGSDGSTIRIRGVGTLNNAEPLVLIDGVEGSMDLVNPQDIENISVLKDAASSSIYGSRAANGVILITTKKGKEGKLSVSYTGRLSYAQPTNLIDQITNYADYMTWINESFENIGQPAHFAQSTIDLWREKSKDPNGLNENGVPNYIAYPNTNWQDYLFGHGLINDHNVSVNGGSDKIRVLMSAGYLDNPGLVENTGIKKYTLRANIEAKITKWLTVGTRTFASQEDKEAGNFDNANNYLRQTTPGLYPEWNGAYGYPEASEESATANSIGAFLNAQDGYKQKTNFNTTLYSTPLKGLSWDFNLNYKRYWEDNATWTNPYEKIRFSDGTVMSPATAPSDMTTYFYNRADYSYTIQNILRYNTTIRDDHDLGIMAGYEEYYYKQDTRNAQKKGLIDSSVHTPGSATEMQSIGGGTIDRSRRSFFGRINLDWENKYLLEVNLRADQSSRFLSNNRTGYFPSASVAWRMDQEAFMEDWVEKGLSNLKFRLSYGSLGNNAVGNYDAIATYANKPSSGSAFNYTLNNSLILGLAQARLANPALTWESTYMTNVGFDFGLVNNKLTGTVDYFNKKTKDILINLPAPDVHGTASIPKQNSATVTNQGIEMTLGWQDQIGDFSYGVNGNFTFVKNKVNKFKGTDKGGISYDGANIIWEGHSINSQYLLRADRIIQTDADLALVQQMIDNAPIDEKTGKKVNPFAAFGTPQKGDLLYKDINGDGIIDMDDREIVSDGPNPKFQFGLNLNAAYKGFDFSVLFQGQAGVKVYWQNALANTSTVRFGYQLNKDVAEGRWVEGRTDAIYPRLLQSQNQINTQMSDFYLENKAFLKIRNIQLGYSLPKSITKKMQLERLRFYGSLENFFTFTSYRGFDPEISGLAYPAMKSAVLGVNVTF